MEKALDLPKRQETIVLGCARRGDSFPVCPQTAEHRLNKLQRWVQAVAISSDTRDRHETLMLLLQPQRILCASIGHYPHAPPAPPPTPGACAVHHCQSPVIQGQLPQENTWHSSGSCNVMLASVTSGSPCIPIITTVPLPPHSMSEPEPPNQPLL